MSKCPWIYQDFGQAATAVEEKRGVENDKAVDPKAETKEISGQAILTTDQMTSLRAAKNFPGGPGVDPQWTGGKDPEPWREWVQYRADLLADGNVDGPTVNQEPHEGINNNNFVYHTHDFSNLTELNLWHQRFGHLNYNAVARIINKTVPAKPIFCQSCCRGKSTLLPAPKEKATRASRVAQLLHTDMAGPMETATPSGKRYLLVIIDDYSRRIFIRLLRTKDEFFKHFQELVVTIEVETTNRVAFLRSDSDGAYTGEELAEYCTTINSRME